MKLETGIIKLPLIIFAFFIFVFGGWAVVYGQNKKSSNKSSVSKNQSTSKPSIKSKYLLNGDPYGFTAQFPAKPVKTVNSNEDAIKTIYNLKQQDGTKYYLSVEEYPFFVSNIATVQNLNRNLTQLKCSFTQPFQNVFNIFLSQCSLAESLEINYFILSNNLIFHVAVESPNDIYPKIKDSSMKEFFDSFKYDQRKFVFTGKNVPASKKNKQGFYVAYFCPVCNGSGQEVHRELGVCPRCNGFGVEEDDEICHVCRGTRQAMVERKTLCQRCAGSGLVN